MSPVIKTERLLLRHFRPGDEASLLEIFGDGEAMRFVPQRTLTSLAEAADLLKTRYLDKYAEGKNYLYAICLKEDENRPIGYVGTDGPEEYDLGYGLLKRYWGQGIAAEAAAAFIHMLQAAGVPYVTATHDINNPASGRVMRKIGMTYQYSYHELWAHTGQWVVFRMYQLNLNGDHPVMRIYWDRYPEHYVEDLEKG